MLSLPFVFYACKSTTGEGVVFGTFYSISIQNNAKKARIKQIENLFLEIEECVSTSALKSDVYKINQAEAEVAISVSDFTVELLELSFTLNDLSKAFNPAIYPLVELWGFDPFNYVGLNTAFNIPTKEQIDDLLPLCKMDNFILNKENKTVTKLNGHAKLDFGAIAKGYAADKAACLFLDNQITLNLGGDIFTTEKKTIFIQSPFNNDYFAKIDVENEGIATCGTYERFYNFEGKNYHHVIGTDGYPAGIFDENPIVSVTVVAKSAAVADALSTAILIVGEDFEADISFCAFLIKKNGDFVILGENRFEII